ncbi:hypothetical protein Tdes44962_MAKER01266 [Teratosphaeria destructans]|uniref:Uncharacterized protein n=1 Tax=Teratosphaeria destructans TaxID=418781 RepID=A0A9W7W729_9PEZI|nr:hypothetical protein Tdes44962_MAKER01266 [Teratosphaeria destructans]
MTIAIPASEIGESGTVARAEGLRRRSLFPRRSEQSNPSEPAKLLRVMLWQWEYDAYFANDGRPTRSTQRLAEPPGGRQAWIKQRLADQQQWTPEWMTMKQQWEGRFSAERKSYL